MMHNYQTISDQILRD